MLQAESGIPGPLQLVVEHPPQDIAAEGQIEVPREHPQAGQGFLDGARAVVLGEAAVIPQPAVPVLKGLPLKLQARGWLAWGWWCRQAARLPLALGRPVGRDRQQTGRESAQHGELGGALQQRAWGLAFDIAAADQPAAGGIAELLFPRGQELHLQSRTALLAGPVQQLLGGRQPRIIAGGRHRVELGRPELPEAAEQCRMLLNQLQEELGRQQGGLQRRGGRHGLAGDAPQQ